MKLHVLCFNTSLSAVERRDTSWISNADSVSDWKGVAGTIENEESQRSCPMKFFDVEKLSKHGNNIMIAVVPKGKE